MSETESKPYYKIGEVCELTGTQPYVLRFWESEFPTLAPEKNRSGQRIYRQRDIELIRRIKLLLYEKEYTIAGARKVLESDTWDEEEGLLADSATETAREAPGGTAVGAGKAHGKVAPAKARHSPRGAGAHAMERPEPEIPFKDNPGADHHLEAEVRNLRAKLTRAEAELRAILAEMERRNDQ